MVSRKARRSGGDLVSVPDNSRFTEKLQASGSVWCSAYRMGPRRSFMGFTSE
jgi:hypothetical protein